MALIETGDIKDRVTYHAPTEKAVSLHGVVRSGTEGLMASFSDILPSCRESSLAITKLEEAMFWANAAIARNHDKL